MTPSRGWISKANANPNPDGSLIQFDSSVFGTAQTITLSSKLMLSESAGPEMIQGPGANLLTISGNKAVEVFQVHSSVVATIAGLTIANGSNSSAGGGIHNSGTLTISNSTLSGNVTGAGGGAIYNLDKLTISNSTLSGNSAGAAGGGIDNSYGTLTVSNSTLSGNSAGPAGGGIYSLGTATISNSTLSGNVTGARGGGGGIQNQGTMTISNSTFSGDSASRVGGGIYNLGGGSMLTVSNSTFSGDSAVAGGGAIGSDSGTVIVSNSTLSGNTAGVAGGGIRNLRGTVTVVNSTFSGNKASFGGGIYNTATVTMSNSTLSGNNASTNGGGLYNQATLTIGDTIVAGDTAPSGPDVYGSVTSNGYNLVGDGSGGSGFTAAGDQVGTHASPINPLLGPLQNNGGPTQTMGLLPGSPAIGAGTAVTGVSTDQRGRFRGSVFDIGAFQASLVVESTAGSVDTTVSNLTLPGAVSLADQFPGAAISFDPTVFGTAQTITLTGSQLELSNTVLPTSITGPAAGVTVSGGGQSRVFQVDSGVTAILTGLTIANGSNSSAGGGIYNSGTLTISNSTLSGNVTGARGGGIYNLGKLTISNSTLSGNSTTGDNGGGIDNNYGTLTVSNSTLSGNSAGGAGGGIDNFYGTLTVSNSTLSGNFAGVAGGGIYSLGTATISNSTLSGNSATSGNSYGGGIQNQGTMTISNSTFSGDSAGAGGGGIYNHGGMLTISNSTLSGDSAGAAGGAIDSDSGTVMVSNSTLSGNVTGAGGGGIYNLDKLTISNSTLSGNSATSGNGGGIQNQGTMTISDSTLSGNSASGDAGGIFGYGGTLTVSDSTLSGNTAGVAGGGIRNLTGTVTVVNSTFSGNKASYGGGIFNSATVTVSDSTLSGNNASTNGGGLYNQATLTIGNTIVARDTALSGPDVYGSVTSNGYNLVGDGSGGSGFTASGDQVGTLASPINPLLGPLQNNGGTTQTMALLPGSPAIAAGSVALIPAGVTTDQRGVARTSSVESAFFGAIVDIGAFESRGFGIAVAGGNNQQTTVNTAFATPLSVTVSSPYGDPVAGGVVTFTAPSSGAGTSPAVNTATIGSSGQASAWVIANTIAGSYAVTASANGVLIATFSGAPTFNLTNVPAAARQLVIVTQPSTTATAGVAFATQPVIYEEDQFGNVETEDNTDTVTAASTGTASLQGTTTVTLVNGVATFSGLSYNKAETITLEFSTNASGVSSATSSNIVVSPAAASQLVITQQPSSTATAGVAFTTQPVVAVEDRFGNVETGDSTDTVTAASTGMASLQGTTTVTLINGVAMFSGLSYNKAETIALKFTTNASGVSSATSNNIVVSPAAATHLLLIAPTSVSSGSAFSLTVQALDVFNNIATGFRGTVMFTSSDNSAGLPGKYTFTASDNGVHTFTGLVLRKKGLQTITAFVMPPPTNSTITGSIQINVV